MSRGKILGTRMLASLVAVSALVGCGSEASPSTAPVGSESVDSLPMIESTLAPVVPVETESSTTIAVDTTVGAPAVDTEVSGIDVDGFRIEVGLPVGAEPDPFGGLEPEGSVLENHRWITECGWLSVTVQSERPRFPANQFRETVEAGGVEWQLHDAGGEDGTQIDATTTIGNISVTVASQDRFPNEESVPGAR